MAVHNVFLDLPKREINKVDAHFYIYKDGEKLGQMTISKGGIDYYSANSKRPIKFNWSQIDKMFKDRKAK